ncbi:MAG: PLP-dependent transferase [Chthonomonadales bacterium]|nr:PLP-dependent transferase [Chthonomonadales bacterium]
MRLETLAIHAGQPPDPAYGAVMPPIYQTSTFAFEAVGKPGAFDYTRSGNPTRKALEDCLAALEGGSRAFSFASGMAAVATALALLDAGDHVLVHDDLYGGTYRYLTNVTVRQGVEVGFVNMRDLDALQAAIRPATRMIWTETPTNPLMNLQDLAAIAAIARDRRIITVTDNTFASPYNQRPLDLGIDISLHSMTKYINGHSDVIAGALIVRDEGLAERLGFLQNALGTPLSPFDCFLVLRGIKTLPIRMEAHNANALAIARWLQEQPAVAEVLHPGLDSHPQRDLAARQMRGIGGTFSFRMQTGDAAVRLLERVKLFTLAESLGGVESLIEHPWTMTHVSVPEDARRRMGIDERMIRISVGIEHRDDLIEDLAQAMGAG